MDDVKRILVVSRSTHECKKAVQYGVSLARKYGTELCILHVIYNPFGLKGGVLFSSLLNLKEEYDAMVKEVRQDIDRMIAEEKAANMEIKELIRDGYPAHVIAQTVKEENADLVVIAEHEEGRLEHLLYSKSMDELTRKMPCSLLLVKAEEFPTA
jgi:universal stress protein A